MEVLWFLMVNCVCLDMMEINFLFCGRAARMCAWCANGAVYMISLSILATPSLTT